jgi:hypothetical protein
MVTQGRSAASHRHIVLSLTAADRLMAFSEPVLRYE